MIMHRPVAARVSRDDSTSLQTLLDAVLAVEHLRKDLGDDSRLEKVAVLVQICVEQQQQRMESANSPRTSPSTGNSHKAQSSWLDQAEADVKDLTTPERKVKSPGFVPNELWSGHTNGACGSPPEPLLASFAAGPLGLGLSNRADGAVVVTSVDDASAAEAEGVKLNSVLVKVNGISTTGMDKAGVMDMIKSSPRPLTLKFELPDASLKTATPPAAAAPTPSGRLHMLKHGLRSILLSFIIFPIVISVAAFALGAAMAEIEGWDMAVGFFYLMSIICGMATPIGEAGNVTPVEGISAVGSLVVALWSHGMVGIIVGLVDDMVAKLVLRRMSLWNPEAKPWRMLLLSLLWMLVVAPLTILCIAGLCGAVLSVCIEHWGPTNGFYYFVGNAVGLPNPLVPYSPHTELGAGVDVYFTIILFGTSAIFLGIAARVPFPHLSELCGCAKDRRPWKRRAGQAVAATKTRVDADGLEMETPSMTIETVWA